MGSRIREDTGGRGSRFHLYEGGLYEGITEGVGRASTRDAPIGERGEEMG